MKLKKTLAFICAVTMLALTAPEVSAADKQRDEFRSIRSMG